LAKDFLNKKYILYGSSIIFVRTLEMLVLFFAAHYLDKENYGSLEYYKKVIEVGASFLSFGFPALILSYTRGENSKKYFYYLSLFFVLLLSFALFPILYHYRLQFLLIPLLFYAIFFTGGITQSYLLVQWGSNKVSFYKMLISLGFYLLVAVQVYYYHVSAFAFVYPSYFLLPPMLIGVGYLYKQQKIVVRKLKQYGRLFYRLLASSFTLVVSNFANLMFLYTDIFIIKLLSDQANTDIANYSFSLNIANALMLIPFTLVQVNIEKLKKSSSVIKKLNKKITLLLILTALFLLVFYKLIVLYFLKKYAHTYILFIIITVAKAFQAMSPLYGTYMVIKKRFRKNLWINLIMLFLNFILSYVLYHKFRLYGVAVASALSLMVRYIILVRFVKRIENKNRHL